MDVAKHFKYLLDKVLALVLLVVLSPLFIGIAIAIRLDSKGSPFFLQERIGAGGVAFTIFKFRTMRAGSENEGLGATTAPHDERITRVGAWLRNSSLDELPQLLNILLGEMSFIGPRPTLRFQVEGYTPRQARRLLFRPGISGWAQIHGRNTIPWAERIELDLYYVDHYSLWLDCEIVWRTIGLLLRRESVYAKDGVANDILSAPQLREPGEPGAKSVPVVLTQSELEPLLIVGAGGHARVVIDVVEKQNLYRIVGLIDETQPEPGAELMGYPILGGREILNNKHDLPGCAFVAIGSPGAREAWHTYLAESKLELARLVHPAATLGREVQIGEGTLVAAGAIVNSGSRIGNGVILNTACSVDHDCVVQDFAHIAPGARLAGSVHVGCRALLGVGSAVIPGIDIGDDVTVGAGAVVVQSIPPRLTVVGVPARPLVVASRPGVSGPVSAHGSANTTVPQV